MNPSFVSNAVQSNIQETLLRPDMSIILVCWNNKDYLEPCLQSLYNAHLKCTYDVIVVDNGSTDGSIELLKAKYPQIKLVCNGKNVGLSRASNQGIEATSGKYVLLLNNDTIVDGPSLDALVDFLNENPSVGAVGGKLMNPDGSFQAGYARFSTLSEEFLIATGIGQEFLEGYPLHYLEDVEVEVDWLCSACLLIRRATLNQVGLLDEEYFIYGDEVDLQYRIKQAGWKIYFLPSSSTIHFGGRSMNRWRRRKMVYRGKLLFYKKNYGKWKTNVLRLLLSVISVLKSLVWVPLAIFPKWRKRAQQELQSNIEVFKLCIDTSP